MGLRKNKENHPIKNEIKDIKRNTFKFDIPKTLIVSRSLLFFISIINFILVIKIIKGNNWIIILGMCKTVRNIGVVKFTSKFLKNSISSNKFKITPKQ